MIDAGYNYDRLEEKMNWLGIDPAAIRHILITLLMPDGAFRLAFTNGLMSESMVLWFGSILVWLRLHRNQELRRT